MEIRVATQKQLNGLDQVQSSVLTGKQIGFKEDPVENPNVISLSFQVTERVYQIHFVGVAKRVHIAAHIQRHQDAFQMILSAAQTAKKIRYVL